MMRFVLRPIPAVLLLAGGVLLVGVPAARAQAPYGESTSYVPYAGSFGGFVPYSGGPGGGLGVQPPMARPMTRVPLASRGMAGGMRPELGAVRTFVTPFAPRPMGAAGSMGMGGLIRRPPAGMGGMTRPPVGSYPFRQPPSLVSPAGPATGMSM